MNINNSISNSYVDWRFYDKCSVKVDIEPPFHKKDIIYFNGKCQEKHYRRNITASFFAKAPRGASKSQPCRGLACGTGMCVKFDNLKIGEQLGVSKTITYDKDLTVINVIDSKSSVKVNSDSSGCNQTKKEKRCSLGWQGNPDFWKRDTCVPEHNLDNYTYFWSSKNPKGICEERSCYNHFLQVECLNKQLSDEAKTALTETQKSHQDKINLEKENLTKKAAESTFTTPITISKQPTESEIISFLERRYNACKNTIKITWGDGAWIDQNLIKDCGNESVTGKVIETIGCVGGSRPCTLCPRPMYWKDPGFQESTCKTSREKPTLAFCINTCGKWCDGVQPPMPPPPPPLPPVLPEPPPGGNPPGLIWDGENWYWKGCENGNCKCWGTIAKDSTSVSENFNTGTGSVFAYPCPPDPDDQTNCPKCGGESSGSSGSGSSGSGAQSVGLGNITFYLHNYLKSLKKIN